MSLMRIALRHAAVSAIRGRTHVGANVLDSPNGALEIAGDGTLRSDEDRPFVAVYTDSGETKDVQGRSLVENGTCVLVIEAGVSAAMTETNEKGESSVVGIGLPASDAAFEFLLDLVQRQVFDALNDVDDPWADIYRSLHYRVAKIETSCASNSEGQRLAGRRVFVTVWLGDDPVRGEALDPQSGFARFMDMLKMSDDPLDIMKHETMQALLGGAEPDWKSLQRRRGLTRAELATLGQGPLREDIERTTPPLTDVSVERPPPGV